MQLDLLEKPSHSSAQEPKVASHNPLKESRPLHRARSIEPPASILPKPIQQPAVSDDALPEEKAAGAFKTISEAAEFLGVPQHVLRFWESKFAQIKPLKMRGGRRYYRPEDMDILSAIKHLLYKQGYTIKGAKKALSTNPRPSATELQPIPTKPTAPMLSKPSQSNRQHEQLLIIRQELINLRDNIKTYL